MRVLLAYVPVLHEGYRQLFQKWGGQVDALYLLGTDLIGEFDHLERKNPQALRPEEIAQTINAWPFFRRVDILNYPQLDGFKQRVTSLVLPREDETLEVAAKYFPHIPAEKEDLFLRWDRSRSLEQKHVNPDCEVTTDAFYVRVMNQVFEAAEMASDWYRQVGAAVIKDGEVVVVGHNRHTPSPHTPYALGSPRSFFKKGLYLELTTDDHAEPQVIGWCARRGIALEGAELAVSTFTCPPCSKLVRDCGFSCLYYGEGYAMLDGETVLRQGGVQIIQVVRP